MWQRRRQWSGKREPTWLDKLRMSSDRNTVTELPVGRYDAARTLRHLQAQAERGDFNYCVVICSKRAATEDSSDEIWCNWSDGMDTQHIWWLASWLVSFLRRRYFSGAGLVRGPDEAA